MPQDAVVSGQRGVLAWVPTAAQTPALPLPTRPIEPSLYPTANFNAMDLVWSSRVHGSVQSVPMTRWSSGEVGRKKCSSALRYEESGSVPIIEKTFGSFHQYYIPTAKFLIIWSLRGPARLATPPRCSESGICHVSFNKLVAWVG